MEKHRILCTQKSWILLSCRHQGIGAARVNFQMQHTGVAIVSRDWKLRCRGLGDGVAIPGTKSSSQASILRFWQTRNASGINSTPKLWYLDWTLPHFSPLQVFCNSPIFLCIICSYDNLLQICLNDYDLLLVILRRSLILLPYFFLFWLIIHVISFFLEWLPFAFPCCIVYKLVDTTVMQILYWMLGCDLGGLRGSFMSSGRQSNWNT